MKALRRLADSLTGRSTRERLAALEQAVRKLGEAERDQASHLRTGFADIGRTLAEQPTAKDLRELRQALRSVAVRADQRLVFEKVAEIAASDKPILVGPWTGEVGFELLYWIPFLEWMRTQGGWSPAREVIVSRGGVASWYGGPHRYCDAFEMVRPDEFRCAVAEEKRKQRRAGEFDESLTKAALARSGLNEADILHPGLMYRTFAPYWNGEAGYERIDQFTRHRLLEAPPDGADLPGLPADYIAVRFYFSECFPATVENEAFARSVVSALAARTPVVVLNPGFNADEHVDWAPKAIDRITTIANVVPPQRNLALQSAVIARARAFVGTYGGYSYLAPLYKVPAVAFYSRPSFKLHHLHAAQHAFDRIGAGPLTLLDVAQSDIVQLSLGALATA
jgi:hypothetical protein